MADTVVDMNTGIDSNPSVEDADQARLDAVIADLKTEAEPGNGEEAATAKAGATTEAETTTAETAEKPAGEAEEVETGKEGATVPIAAVTAARGKLRDEQIAHAKTQAKLDLLTSLAENGVVLSPAQSAAILSGKTIAQVTAEAEPAADPHELLDQKEIALAKLRSEGDVDEVEYTTQKLAIDRERRTLIREEATQTVRANQEQAIESRIAKDSRSIQDQFEVFAKGGPGGAELTQGQLNACIPMAQSQTHAKMEEAFGPGVKYDNRLETHRLFYQWNIADIAHRFYGEPLGLKAPSAAAPGPKTTVKEAATTSPAARKANAAITVKRGLEAPPDLTQYSHGAETDLGIAERKLAQPGTTTEESEAIFKKHPQLLEELLT